MNDGKDGVLTLHNEASEAIESFQGAFADYAQSEKWMGALWRVKDDGKVELFRTTWQFPKDKFVAATVELTKALNAEKASGTLSAEPLPRARLFDDGEGFFRRTIVDGIERHIPHRPEESKSEKESPENRTDGVGMEGIE